MGIQLKFSVFYRRNKDWRKRLLHEISSALDSSQLVRDIYQRIPGDAGNTLATRRPPKFACGAETGSLSAARRHGAAQKRHPFPGCIKLKITKVFSPYKLQSFTFLASKRGKV